MVAVDATATSTTTEMESDPQCLKSEVAPPPRANTPLPSRDFCYTNQRRRRRTTVSASQSRPAHSPGFPPKFMLTNIGPDSEHHSCGQSTSDSEISLPRLSQSVVPEVIFKSLKESEGGVGRCIRAALEHHGIHGCTEKDCSRKGRCCLSDGFVPTASRNTVDGDPCTPSAEMFSKSSCACTELCHLAFFDILVSQEFTALCKLFSDYFGSVQSEKLFGYNFVDRRIKERAYERMPLLFPSDIHQFWRKIEAVGAEMVSLAKLVSDRSNTCCKQLEGMGRYIFEEGMQQFSMQGLDNFEKLNHPDAFAEVEGKTKECFVYQSCEGMYHVPCVEPAGKGSVSRNGLGDKRLPTETRPPQADCVVCEKLKTLKILTDREGTGAGEASIDHEESINCDLEERICKFCGDEIRSNEKYKVCGHKFCNDRIYHERCLTVDQHKSHASCWYCPSCLCRVCLIDKDDEEIILCDSCDHGYHIHCLKPPLSSVPKGKWFCATCKGGLEEIARVKKAYISLAKNKREIYADGKERDGKSRKKQKTSGEQFLREPKGMEMLLNAQKLSTGRSK